MTSTHFLFEFETPTWYWYEFFFVTFQSLFKNKIPPRSLASFVNSHEEVLNNQGVFTFGRNPNPATHRCKLLTKCEEFRSYQTNQELPQISHDEAQFTQQDIARLVERVQFLRINMKKPMR